jgi:hypothetical protein
MPVSPFTESVSFPVTHPQYHGSLPPAIGLLCERLRGFDLAIVVGAQIFASCSGHCSEDHSRHETVAAKTAGWNQFRIE